MIWSKRMYASLKPKLGRFYRISNLQPTYKALLEKKNKLIREKKNVDRRTCLHLRCCPLRRWNPHCRTLKFLLFFWFYRVQLLWVLILFFEYRVEFRLWVPIFLRKKKLVGDFLGSYFNATIELTRYCFEHLHVKVVHLQLLQLRFLEAVVTLLPLLLSRRRYTQLLYFICLCFFCMNCYRQR